MADRMNIKFTIRAVDNFSKTMNNLERKLDNVQRKADSLDLSRRVDIDVDTAGANAQLTALQEQIDGLGGGNADLDVDVQSAGALAELTRIRAAAAALESARIRVDVDSAVASATLARLGASRDNLSRRPGVISVIVGGYRQFRNNMDRIATTGRNVGEILQNTFMGVATTFGTVLIPIIASTTGAIGALGVMIGVTGGATMGLASSLVSAGSGFGLFALAGTEVIGTLFGIASNMDKTSKEWKALSQNTRDAVNEIGVFQLEYRKMMQSFREPITDMFIVFMKAVNGSLMHFEPIVAASVAGMGKLVDSFAEATKSDDMHAFFTFLAGSVSDSMQTIGKALGNFVMGFLNMMVAFGPLAIDMQNGFLKMSEGFREWSAALGDNTKFQAFVDYVRANWPAVRTIIGTAIAAIIETFAGFSGYAKDWMSVTQELINKWREFAQGMGDNAKFQAFLDYIRTNGPKVNALIGALVGFLVALGVALAPVGSKMMEVATEILNFLTNLLETNPEMSKMLGFALALAGGLFTLLPAFMFIVSAVSTLIGVAKLFGPVFSKIAGVVTRLIPGFARLRSAFTTVRIVMMMIGGPVMWIIGILLLLVPVFKHLWETSDTFRSTITSAFEAVKSAVESAISAVSEFVMSTWGTLVAWWEKNGEMIKEAASNVWGVISTVITTAMTVIAAIIKFVWPAVLFIIKSVWGNIKGVITGALDIIMGIVTAFAGLFTGNWSAMWDGIKQMVKGVATFLWNAVQLLMWGKLLKGIVAFAGMFRGAAAAMWAGVKSLFTRSLTAIKTKFMSIFNGIKSYLSELWVNIYVTVGDALIAIRTAIATKLTAIKNFFYEIWLKIYVTVGDFLIKVRTVVGTKLTAIKNFFSEIWTRIYVTVGDKLIAIKTFITTKLNAIKNFFSDVWTRIYVYVDDAIKKAWGVIQTVFTKVKDFLFSILDNITSKVMTGFTKIYNTIKSVLSSVDTFFTGIVGNILGKMMTFLTRMVTAARTKFNAIKTTISTKITEAKNALLSKYNEMKSIASEKISSMVSTAKTKFSSMVATAKEKFNAIKTTISTKITEAKNALLSKYNEMKSSASEKISSMVSTAKSKFSSMVATVKEKASAILSTIRTKFDSIVNAVKVKMDTVIARVKLAWGKVMTFLRGIDLAEIGRNIISGLIGGIKSMAKGVLKAAKGVVEGAVTGVKKFLHIDSPSKVFRSIGEFTMMGMQVGINREASNTISAVTRVADKMTKAFAPELNATMGVASSGYNAYTSANSDYASARNIKAQERAQESRTVVEVPVYLNGREIAKASNDEQKRLTARENARVSQFSRTGGTQ